MYDQLSDLSSHYKDKKLDRLAITGATVSMFSFGVATRDIYSSGKSV